MRILYITNSPTIGGAELSLLSHLRTLNKDLFSITLLCSEKLFPYALNVSGITVKKMHFYNLYSLNPVVIYRYFKMVRAITTVIREEKVDIIHTNSVKAHYLGIFAALLSKKKLIWWMRDDTMNRLIYSLARKIPHKIIFISEYIASRFKTDLNTAIVYNGTDIYKNHISLLEIDRLKKHLGVENTTIILCTERLVLWKGVQVLIEALEKIKFYNFTCLIAGTGKDQRDDVEFSLIKRVGELGLTKRVKFLGFRQDIGNLMQICDILVHPVIEPEPFGLVLIEAMSFQKSVISSNLGGPKEIIHDGDDGILIPAGNIDILAEKLVLLINNNKLREQIGKQAELKVQNSFTQEVETRSIEKIYFTI